MNALNFETDDYGQFIDLEIDYYRTYYSNFNNNKIIEYKDKPTTNYTIYFCHIVSCISITILVYYTFNKKSFFIRI
jgi:hypothetical protein